MPRTYWEVTYTGFLATWQRTFPTYGSALQWVRQVGKEREATITYRKEAPSQD